MSKTWKPNWSMPKGSLDGWAEDYERSRPGWPSGVVGVAALPQTATVLDLGAGTGKLTRLLAAAFDRVIAVEPAAPMRQLLASFCPEVAALTGTAEAIPLPDASVDAVFVAQALHTFDEPRALPEIARVLTAGASLVHMWNLPAGEWQPSTAAAEAVLAERMPRVDYIPLDLGGPDAASGWQPGITNSPFEAFRATTFAHRQTLDREGVVAFYASMGWLADLPDDERLPLLDSVRSCLDAGEYERAWEAHVHWARLR
jgi:SAM-dependent methyltransferase